MYIWLFVRCCRGNRKEECGTELWDCRDTSNTEITGPWPRWITATSGRENRGNNEPRGKENTLGMLQTNHYYENTVGVPQSNHYYVIGTILIHFWSLSLTRSFFSKHASRQTTWHTLLHVSRAHSYAWRVIWEKHARGGEILSGVMRDLGKNHHVIRETELFCVKRVSRKTGAWYDLGRELQGGAALFFPRASSSHAQPRDSRHIVVFQNCQH